MMSNVQPRTRISKRTCLVCITILVLAGFCFSQSAPSASSEVLTNWTEFHRPNMTRWNPYESVLNVGNVGRLASKWNYATGGSVNSNPAVVNGMVYVGSVDKNVYALKASTGAKLWSFRTGGQVLFSAPAVANGVVYIGSGDSKVYALKASTGAKLWSYTIGAVWFPRPRLQMALCMSARKTTTCTR